MRWLIIDDDEYKVENLKKYLSAEDHVYSFNCFTKGMYEIAKNYAEYDVLVLDMNFPISDNKKAEINMGLTVLEEMERIKISLPVVIYSSAKVDVSEYKNVIEYIHYDSSIYIKSTVEAIKEKVKKYLEENKL